jgi:hypothetical protein
LLRARLGDRAGEVESAIGLDVNTVASAEAWASLSWEAVARLVIAAAETSGRPVLALDPGVVTRAELDRLRQELPDRTILICSDSTGGRVADLGLARTLVASVNGELVAVGSPGWIARNIDAVRARYGSSTEDARDDDDDEELDDED